MISVKYLVFITCLNLGIAGYWGDNNEWKAVSAQSAADDTAHAYDRSKRQANSMPSYTIELLMVIDFSLFRFWEERVRDEGNITASQIPQDAVRNKIRKFYASMGKSINFRFQNISDPYFAISVEVVDIFIADTEISSSWTETSKNISNERNIYVKGDQSLELFNNWINSFNNLIRHDHAMLFTRYNIEYNNLLVSGLTSGYPACGIKSGSLVHDHFNSISATSAARLLGYSLGARSDGDGNLCSPTDNYIMSPFNAPGEGDKALNPWRFSSCSVQAFSTFLTGLNSTQDRTCLQSDDAVAINDDRTFPGSEYAVDEQCRFIRDNSSFLCRLNYEGDFSNICTNMLCYDSTSGTCANVLPADGLSCGTGKWCENGRCVNSSRAPNNTDICLFGDADALCSSLYPSFLQYCYNESSYLICCDTCSRYKQNVSGCEFGDSKDCSQVLHISQCADDTTLHMCCSTCATLAASACPAGFFRSTEGNCLTCNKGTYQPYLEQSLCITCPSGTTTLTTGSNSSTQCVATCNSGFFRTTNGSCETCPVATYQTSIEQSSCLSCPSGTTTKQIASTSRTQCVDICSAGFFLNNLDSCQACLQGTYQPSAGQESCISCQTGTVTLQAGSTSSTQCVATCSSGFFRTPNGSCQACSVGTYQSIIEQSSCLSCPNGTTTHEIASTSQTQCVAVCSSGFFLNISDSCEACPRGTYQPSAGQVSCISCPTETVTLQTGSMSIIQCVAACSFGFFRTTSGTCQACPVGTYQESMEQSSCLPCPTGTSTNQTATTSRTQCVGCEFGDSKDCSQVLHISQCADDTTLHMCCSTCATLAATSCSAGFYLTNLGRCQACLQGTYQPSAGQAFCISCQTGTVTLQAGSTSSTQCVATCSSGFFRTPNGSCQACSVGTYQSIIEQSSCLSCPNGTTTHEIASTSQAQCVAVCSSGFFLNISDSCEACPRGTYQPSAGQVSCISCPTETVTLQTGSMSITQCVAACSSGFFRATTGNCQACPVGTYQESMEQSSCLPCPTGISTNQTASTSRTQCVVNNCPAGTYQDFSGSPCIPCAAGSYQPQPRQSACIQCPTGTYQPNITSTECIQCSPGSYQNTIGSSSCRSCKSGAYQPDFGQTYCIQCTAGTYQPNIGTSTTCNLCDPGSYQNETGSSSCVLCEAGTYQPSPGNSSCTACPKGKYQGRRGSIMCEVCKAGNYQPEVGKATCIACPSGTYQRQNDFTSCVKCDPGFYQNNTGGSSCNPCEEGHYNSISGDESCRLCEIGTYQNSTGQSFCFPCPNKYTTQKDGERSVRACFQGYCPEYRYNILVSAYNISVIIPSTKVNQTGYSWNRCKEDSSKALVSAFCQNISRTEVAWTQEKVECTLEPEIQDVQTSPISEQLHTISKIDVNDTDYVNILQKTNALIKSVDVLMPVDYGYLADILDNTNMAETVSKEVLNATLDVIDTLLRLNSSTNQSSQTSPGAPNRILKLVEDITSKTEGGTVDNPVRTIKPNIAVTVWEQVGAKLIGINLLRGNTAGIQDNLVKQLEDPAAKDLYDAIFFQPDILNATKNKIVMTAIWNDALFMSGSNRYKVVSKILAAKLIQNGVSITRLDKSYITSVFHVTEDDSRIMCGYWDYTLNQNGGGWASGGCNYTRNNESHVCTCNHLTNFAVLVDLDAKTISPEHARALEIITFIGLILSIIGLSFTILTFMCFRHLRRGRGQQTLFCLCIPMVCYSIVFLVGIQRTEYYVPCIVVSVLIHYFILASFMWMLVEGILQYLRFVKVLGTYIPNFLIKTSLPAWGIPLVPVIVLLAYNYNLYYGGSGFCWMKLEALYYAFVLPVSLIILVNAIIFTIVMFNIFRRPKGMKINQSDRRLMVMNLQAGISVFVLLGLTWIFGVLSLGGAKLTFQYIFVILNAFQGFFIFLMFTAREKQVRDQWIRFCRRRPTGYFTSLGRRKSSSQDTFATNVSGGMRRSSSSSFMDNRDRKLSSSCQDHRRRSNQSETNESVQDRVRRNSSAQQLERDVKSVDSVVHEIDFSSLHEHKKAKTSLGKYIKTSEVNKHKSSNKDGTHELRKTSEHSKRDVTMCGKYLSKSVPDHLSSNYSFADPSGIKKIKGGHLSRSGQDEARSNIILFNSIGRKHNSNNDFQGDNVVFPLGRSVDDLHDKRKRRQITQFRHDEAYF